MGRYSPEELDRYARDMAEAATAEQTLEIVGEAIVFGRDGCLLKEAVQEALAEAVEKAVTGCNLDESKIDVTAIVKDCRMELADPDNHQSILYSHFYNQLR